MDFERYNTTLKGLAQPTLRDLGILYRAPLDLLLRLRVGWG